MPSLKTILISCFLLAATTSAEKWSESEAQAKATIDVNWKSHDSITVALNVKDTQTNGNDAYAWYRVYYADGNYKDSQKLWDRQGGGASEPAFPWNGHGIDITGVRLWACQDDYPPDTCVKGSFHANKA